MSARSHELIEELVVANVLDGLEPGELAALDAEMASQGPDCHDCARLVAEYEDVAGSLAMAVDPVPLAAGAEDRLISAARAWTQGLAEGRVAVLEPVPAPVVRPVRRRGVRVRRWVVAAAAAVIVVAAGSVGYLIAPGGGTPQTVAFAAKGGQRLAVVYVPGSQQAVLVGSNVDAPPAGKVYELWYVAKEGANPTPAGTFQPDASGSVLKTTTVGKEFVAVAVSVEPPGGSTTPTKIILVQNV